MDAMDSVYRNGHWVWDDEISGVQFVNHEAPKIPVAGPIGPSVRKPAKQLEFTTIRFKDRVDNLEKITFRRYFQRHVKRTEPEIISVQDIKDVALYLANPKDLTVEFIHYFHLKEIDRFLRAVIAYFQYYLQVWEYNKERREEAKRKLTQPVVTELENIIRDDLSDLRCMVAREYSFMIMGTGKCNQFHHLTQSTNSLSEKDRRIFEALNCMTVRVAWIALQRRHLSLIDLEVNRLLRTDYFNLFLHRGAPGKMLWRSDEENRVLTGTTNVGQSKLNSKSGLTMQLLLGDHDYRMLGVGFKQFEPPSERSLFLEKMYAAPEEILLENGVTIGLIGIPRDNYDCMMLPLERTSKNFDKIRIEPIDFKFPIKFPVPDEEMPKTYPQIDCQYKESPQTRRARTEQRSMWRNYLLKIEPKPADSVTSVQDQ